MVSASTLSLSKKFAQFVRYHDRQHRVKASLYFLEANAGPERVQGVEETPRILDFGDVGAVADDGAGPRHPLWVLDDNRIYRSPT